MNCPYCNGELEHTDSYGNSDYILRGKQSGKSGDIYKCPNFEGFVDLALALEYKEKDGLTEDLEEVVCGSAVHNGNFYTDRSGNLHDGYPC